ncbi:hypothetical protein C8Q74DRAFT_1198208 [Fomes fomentarius]|nr:hypothetical protein C8Q74DRAFT_1198208 [Fomes fomentarius]
MSAPSRRPTQVTHPLPLSSTLHDLALLRASDLDFASLLPTSSQQPDANADTNSAEDALVEKSVQRSLEFSREARTALKLLHSDAVEREGARVEEVRGRLEDVVSALDA